jgi:hypothetical protein
MRAVDNSSMDDVAMHLDTTSNAGWHFGLLAGELGELLNNWFHSNMSVLGDYIGTDSAAMRFNAAYEPHLDALDTGTLDLIQGVYGLGATLTRLTDAFTGDEQATADALRGTKRR